MNFEQHQTAYDRQLPDELESTPLTYNDASNDNLWYIAEKLAERVADGKNLSWGYRRSFITFNHVQTALAEDYDTMYELTRLTIESDANEAQKYLLAKWDEKAKDMIYEAIGEEMGMPVGYDWSDFI